MTHIAITNLLDFMTDNGHKIMITFLEDNHAAEILLSMLSDDETKNEKIFLFLTNIIASVEIDSPLLSPFENVQIMNNIFQRIMTTSNPHVASKALNLLYELTGQCDTEEEETNNTDPLYESVFKFIVNKIPDICNFITSKKPFLADKSSAVELLNILLNSKIEIKPCVTDLLENLFNQTFELPAHTILQRSFLTLFTSILQINDKSISLNFIEKTNMKKRIMQAYEKRYTINASYWGVLYSLATKIIEKFPDDKSDPAWINFTSNTIHSIKDIIDRNYGGEVPDENTQDSDSEDMEFPLGKSQLAKQASIVTKHPAKLKITDEEEDFDDDDFGDDRK